jgi:RNA recognition motif-containing protein
MTESELRAMVSPFGTVQSIHMVRDSFTGISLGYAFVEMTK